MSEINYLDETGLAAFAAELWEKIGAQFDKKPTYTDITMTAAGWSGGKYSFEAAYPSASYDIEIAISNTATAAQAAAFAAAMMASSVSDNVVTALGTVPTIDIPICVKAVSK